MCNSMLTSEGGTVVDTDKGSVSFKNGNFREFLYLPWLILLGL
jgi:hypothetical protein